MIILLLDSLDYASIIEGGRLSFGKGVKIQAQRHGLYLEVYEIIIQKCTFASEIRIRPI